MVWFRRQLLIPIHKIFSSKWPGIRLWYSWKQSFKFHYLSKVVLGLFWYYYLIPTPTNENTSFRKAGIFVSCLLLYSQCLKQNLAHSRYSITLVDLYKRPQNWRNKGCDDGYPFGIRVPISVSLKDMAALCNHGTFCSDRGLLWTRVLLKHAYMEAKAFMTH